VTNSQEARELLNSSLFTLRNKLVFHFDIAEVGRQLKSLELEERIVVSAMGTTNGQVYYEVADLCAVRTFSGPALVLLSDQAALDALGRRMEITSKLITDFLTPAEELPDHSSYPPGGIVHRQDGAPVRRHIHLPYPLARR
jgi:hypothetical protein